MERNIIIFLNKEPHDYKMQELLSIVITICIKEQTKLLTLVIIELILRINKIIFIPGKF